MSRITNQTLLLTAIPLAFLLLLLGLAAVIESRNELIVAQSQRSAKALEESGRTVQLISMANRSVGIFEQTHKPADLREYYGSMNELFAVAAALSDDSRGDAAQYARAQQLKVYFEQAAAILREYVRDIQTGNAADEKRITASPNVRRLNTDIISLLAAFENGERLSTTSAMRAIRSQLQIFTLILLGVCIAGIALTIALSIRFGLRITRRILRLAENAQLLAEGKNPQGVGGNDEISQLDTVYREMARRMQSEERRATALQQALLPQELPAFPGVRIDAAYAPAAGEAQIAGDWYDVFKLSERRVGISIGDVAGHGLRAAAIMGNARQAIRTISYFNDSPAGVLTQVNKVLCRNEGGVLVTAFFATLDLIDGTLQYSLAGHPSPLIVRTGGTVQQLPGQGFVLGVEPRMEFESQRTQLDIGSALVLYTDGVVESDGDYFNGIERLRDAVEEEYRNAEHNIAQAIQRRMTEQRQPRDDSALLFIGITALGSEALRPERVVWSLDARVERSARRVKRALLWHLGEIAGKDADLSLSELILSEMLGNVARHTPGPAEAVLEWSGNGITLSVFDEGPRFDPPVGLNAADLLSESGRGIFLLRMMARQFSVRWTGKGNCVSAVLPLDLELPAYTGTDARGAMR